MTTPTGVSLEIDDAALQAFVRDDLGEPARDVTSDALFGDAEGRARVVARTACVVSGVAEAAQVFSLCGADATPDVDDGDEVSAGATILHVAGPTRAILRAERTALNILGRMSGIATMTRQAQSSVARVNPSCRVAATRKTTPGFRLFEKRAVVHGGGDPHRYGLYDQVLVKDNHRLAGGDLKALIARVQDANPDLVIEVEVEDLDEAEVAARAGVDWVLVDNQDPDGVQRFAERVRTLSPTTRIEASGGITPESAHRFAPFVDRVSMGALTQAARAVDVSLEWD